MRKSKNSYFYHIFVSPGDAPGTITLNVVWMEREFDAYKLPRCMCTAKVANFMELITTHAKRAHEEYQFVFISYKLMTVANAIKCCFANKNIHRIESNSDW